MSNQNANFVIDKELRDRLVHNISNLQKENAKLKQDIRNSKNVSELDIQIGKALADSLTLDFEE